MSEAETSACGCSPEAGGHAHTGDTDRHAFLALPQHEEAAFQQQQVKSATRPCKASNTLTVMLLKVLRRFYTFPCTLRINVWNCHAVLAEQWPADKTCRIKLAVLSPREIGRFDSLLCEERVCFQHISHQAPSSGHRRRLTDCTGNKPLDLHPIRLPPLDIRHWPPPHTASSHVTVVACPARPADRRCPCTRLLLPFAAAPCVFIDGKQHDERIITAPGRLLDARLK